MFSAREPTIRLVDNRASLTVGSSVSVAIVSMLLLAPLASANLPNNFSAPYHLFVGTYAYNPTSGYTYYGYQHEGGNFFTGKVQMSQQVDGGNYSCGSYPYQLGQSEMSQYANFTTSTFLATPLTNISVITAWSWQVWTFGHLAYSCLSTQDHAYAYVHALAGIEVNDANTGLLVGSYSRILWSQALSYNSSNVPYPSGASWGVNKSAQNIFVDSNFTLGGGTSGTYYITAYVWVFTAAGLLTNNGDAWACADGFTTGTSCSGVLTGGSGWTLDSISEN
jgi:hypothetical protein